MSLVILIKSLQHVQIFGPVILILGIYPNEIIKISFSRTHTYNIKFYDKDIVNIIKINNITDIMVFC